jgi:Xaa-Pro aminopeptidase
MAALVSCGFAGDLISHEEYRSRRATLRKSLADGVAVLFGRTAKEVDELRSGFFQEPNFYYMTGWKEPGAILLLAPKQGNFLPNEILFLPVRDPEQEKYTGRKASVEDENIHTVTGFEHVLPAESFESQLLRFLEFSRKVYTLSGHPAASKLEAMLPLREVADVTETIGRLRLKKSSLELELIQKSIEATVAAHRTAWERIAPGLFEFQVASTLVGTFLEQGCERSAYAPIVGSGPNGTVLHYSTNSRRMDRGELLLIDAGAECSGYTADITRTIPVDGKFTPRQRELYETVLGAQRAVLAAVKPGMTLDRESPNSLTQIARDYIDSHGKDRQGHPLGKYFTHRVGHHVGLEVHDAGKLLTYGPLEAGMVITVEPGIYIPEEGMGIRIEDMLLVTETGARVLSSALPKEPDEIEKAFRR